MTGPGSLTGSSILLLPPCIPLPGPNMALLPRKCLPSGIHLSGEFRGSNAGLGAYSKEIKPPNKPFPASYEHLSLSTGWDLLLLLISGHSWGVTGRCHNGFFPCQGDFSVFSTPSLPVLRDWWDLITGDTGFQTEGPSVPPSTSDCTGK